MTALAFSPTDLEDIRTLVAFLDAEDASDAEAVLALAADVAEGTPPEDLLVRGLLVPDPVAGAGARVGVVGLARVHRFMRAAVGSAGPSVPIHLECALRRRVLDVLEPDDRAHLEEGMVRDLLALRERLFCRMAETCRVTGCPLSGAREVELCDLALFWIARERPWPLAGATAR